MSETTAASFTGGGWDGFTGDENPDLEFQMSEWGRETEMHDTGPATDRTVYDRDGIRIVRRVSGYAYPRNGNVHNPTPRYLWLTFKGGAFLGFSDSRRAARELAQ